MSKPTVSVIIPVYNEETYIGPCLDALMKQTLKPDEIIVVDNNSTDKSIEIAHRYDVRVVTASVQGIMPARTVGYDVSRSDIIARIDADTISEPEWLERMVSGLDDPEIVAVSSPTWFYETRTPQLAHWLLKVFYFGWNRWVCGVQPLFGSDMAFRSSVWREIRSKQILHTNTWEDLDFAITLQHISYVCAVKPRKHNNHGVVILDEPSASVSMRSAADSLPGVIRYMWRWPMTYYYRRNWRGLIGSLLGLGCLFLFAPIVLLTTLGRSSEDNYS